MKKKFLVLYIIIALMVLCTNVYAALTAKISLTADKTSVKAGEDVIVSVTLSNMSSSIASVKGYIDVDENVLSAPSESMIVKNSDGKIEVTSEGSVTNKLSYVYAPTEPVDSDVVFNTSSSATSGHDVYFTEDFKTELTKDSVILKLKFTVKEGTTNGNLTDAVKIEALTAESSTMADGTATTEKVENLSAKITIVVNNDEDEENNAVEENNATTDDNNTNTDNTNTNTNKNTNTNNTNNTNTNTNKNTNTNNTNTNNTNTNTNKNTNTDNTVSATKLPATGARTIIIPAIVLFIIGFISYRKYMNYKDI